MKLWQTSTRRAALALLAAAVVVPTALSDNGRPVAGYPHLQELTAMANSYRAQASKLATTPAGYPHLQELTALANSYRAQASRIAPMPAGYPHLQELTALANSYRAQASRIAPMPAGYPHLQELTALANSYRAQASKLAIASSASVTEPASTTSGFDWVDAGIGAMSGFGVAFAVAGTVVFVLGRRPRGQGPRTPRTALRGGHPSGSL